jgi:geranylgeranyl pyrophosphate synthase
VRADLREGKPSLAMILGCKASPWIRNWYLEHVRADAPPPGAEDIAWIAGELEVSGALRGVRQVLETEKNRALGLLADLPRTSGVKDVETFADLLLSSEFRV